MQDSALDFVVFIIVAVIVTSLGFKITLPVVKDTKELYYSESYDKTVDKLEGDKARNEFDGCMNSKEIVLACMGQTHYIPDPGYINIAGERINVANNIAFSPNSIDIGVRATNAVNSWYNAFRNSATKNNFIGYPTIVDNARFKIQFDMNNPKDKTDDSYSLYIRLKRNEPNAKYEMYKCLPGGKVKSLEGVVL